MDMVAETLRQCEEIDPRIQVLLLSLTGSRAFGWAGKNFDYDVHGVFAREGYWDNVHNGVAGIDLNLWELRHIVKMDIEYHHFETFQNMANPIYIHPKFDYETMMGFCSIRGCDEGSIRQQYRMLEVHENPRTALHCYRIAMVRNHWLVERSFELDVFKMAEEYRAEIGATLEALRESYVNHKPFHDYDRVRRELGILLGIFRELKEATEDWVPDKEEVLAWYEGTRRCLE